MAGQRLAASGKGDAPSRDQLRPGCVRTMMTTIGKTPGSQPPPQRRVTAKALLHNAPFTFSGLALAWGGLGNFFQNIPPLRYAFATVQLAMIILVIAKMASNPKAFVQMTLNPVACSTFATFPMALMVFSTYLHDFWSILGLILWYFAIALHITIALHFTVRILPKVGVPDLYASFFIVYVGIGIAAVTSPFLHQEAVGRFMLLIATIGYLVMLPPILQRYIRYRDVPPMFRPTICIFVAPPSVLLAGYYRVEPEPLLGVMVALCVWALLLYVSILPQVPILLFRKRFFPTYAALSFPFVIASRSMRFFGFALGNMGFYTASYAFEMVFRVEVTIAMCLTFYVTYRFVRQTFSIPSSSGPDGSSAKPSSRHLKASSPDRVAENGR